MLANIPRLMTAYYTTRPDAARREQKVAFGTSGHRGSAFVGSFNEAHILAITQAICAYRRRQAIDGPLFLGIDTHALSESAFASALEVLAAHGIDVMIDDRAGYTPTPVISHAILTYNRGRTSGLADGIVVTPSHNPPEDGGFKYNPPHGGPGTPTSPHGSRMRRTRSSPAVSRAWNGSRSSERAVRRPPTALTTWALTSPTSGARWTWRSCAGHSSLSRSIRWEAPGCTTGR